ncbi:unnamed protein product [Boreogadus saida]
MENKAEEAESKNAAKRIGEFLKMRNICHAKNDWGSIKWKGATMPHPLQQDSSSCGVIVTMTAEKALDFPIANMPLYSDISGTETGKCTDCTKLQQTVALFETRLAALEKCKGLLQDTVQMGEFAELTQIQHDDQSYISPRTRLPPMHPETRPDGQCGQRRNNQSPWRRAAHASATSAPLTPEMCPDRRYGQRWNN